MEKLNINKILGRIDIEQQFCSTLNFFEENKKANTTKRGIYIYGAPGSGKTWFVNALLKKMNYDIIKFDAGDVRNKVAIETITKHNIADYTIISLFKKKKKKIAIIMDEIDGMNSGDKGGINSLIKLIRPKKTKKQKIETISISPIICIGNYHIDKKIKELIKVCVTIELKTPTKKQIGTILQMLMGNNIDISFLNQIIDYIQGDLRKLATTYNIYKSQHNIFKNKIIHHMFKSKVNNEDAKTIAKRIMNTKFKIKDHFLIMNETDRTSVGLLFHENIIDTLYDYDIQKTIPFYISVLENMRFADYIDRITFQKQIWAFNEMSSLIKTLYNNKLYHETYPNKKFFTPSEMRFTKALTKYSTEFNNMLFINNLCIQLDLDKKDLFSYFLHLRKKMSVEQIFELFNNPNYNIKKLDILRILRFLDRLCLENYNKESKKL